ncbi:hypothetical protein D3C75_1086650 [compost metagenome]
MLIVMNIGTTNSPTLNFDQNLAIAIFQFTLCDTDIFFTEREAGFAGDFLLVTHVWGLI